MSCGVVVVGSVTQPVQEGIEHGSNGLLVDFFDAAGLAPAKSNHGCLLGLQGELDWFSQLS